MASKTLDSLKDIYPHNITSELNNISNIINKNISSQCPFLESMDLKGTLNSGKMIRSTLILALAQMTGSINDNHRYLAIAIELIHNASLLHDDVIDNAEIRRDHKTTNAIYSNSYAVLLGDYFISLAYKFIQKINSPDQLNQLTNVISQMCRGELFHNINKKNFELKEAEYLSITEKKTGLLFAISCKLSIQNVNFCENLSEFAWQFGLNLGLAYQIRDDILDIFANPNTLRKPEGLDQKNSFITLPILLGYKNASLEQKKFIIDTYLNTSSIRDLRKLLIETQALQLSINKLEEFAQKAQDSLEKIPSNATHSTQNSDNTFIHKNLLKSTVDSVKDIKPLLIMD